MTTYNLCSESRDAISRTPVVHPQPTTWLRCSPGSSLHPQIDDDDIPAAVDQNSHCHRGRRAGVSTRSRLLRTCVNQHDLDYNMGRVRPSYCRPTPRLNVFPIRHRSRNRVLVNVDRSRTTYERRLRSVSSMFGRSAINLRPYQS